MFLSVVIGIIRNEEGNIFITRRHNTLHVGGVWEFPGGKVEHDERLDIALRRELREEVGIEVIMAKPLISFRYTYPECEIQFYVFEIMQYLNSVESQLGQGWIWVKQTALQDYIFPTANKVILNSIYLPPFYAILDDEHVDLFAQLQNLLEQGITLIQARLKNLSEPQLYEFLEIAYPLCNSAGAWLLVNSSTIQSTTMLCDGLHLTRQDLLALDYRPESLRWLSASCHNLTELKHAEKIGVDFVVLAPIMKTQTHPDATPLGWDIFELWVSECNLPVYALGGMTRADLDTAKLAGGQGIAGIRTFLSDR